MTLESVIKRFRRPARGDPKRYISTWTEEEVLDGEVADCYVMVLRTKGCYWSRSSGCSMCGYINDCAEEASPEDVVVQFENAMEGHADQKYLKIYTSGSFLDDEEIGANATDRILSTALSKVERVLIESRPEFVSKERLERLPDPVRIEIAMGLESANDVVLRHSVNKNMRFEDFQRASELCGDFGISPRAYILVKPPFLTEREAMVDAVSTAESAAGVADTISFNPVNVQRNTLVEFLWRRAEFRPPWLWTVLDVVERSKGSDARVVVSTAGAGSRRGAHNCGTCDSTILDFLRDFSKDNSIDMLDATCDCRELWLDLLDVQGPMQSSADPLVFYDR
jgi:radical SAM enzyme (TIGR01210 family)